VNVPQTYANGVLIVQGARSEEIFMVSLQKLEQEIYFLPDIEAEQIETDPSILGGGPAGLTAGIYAARAGLRTVIIKMRRERPGNPRSS
jgi:thioredoxin reductase (NADPH)